MQKAQKINTLILASLGIILAVFFGLAAIAQNQDYHAFADARTLIGIARFCDVMSNLPFVLFGIWGLWVIAKNRQAALFFVVPHEALLWKLLFAASILVGFGSGYYHLNPNNHTLVWDRLPMTLAFMSFFALVLMERVDEKAGFVALFPLLALGVGSVMYWDYTESIGEGDLRPYLLVQFLPILLTPALFLLFPGRYTGMRYLIYALAWYVLAKVLEYYDATIFSLTREFVSGHSLKHIAASFSIAGLVLYLKNRKPTKKPKNP